MRFFKWFKHDVTNAVAEGEIKKLTDQFYLTLRAYFAPIQSAGNGASSPSAFKRAEELLDPKHPRTWGGAYEIEQMLVHLFDKDTLKAELGVRSLEARAALRPQLADFYAKELQDAKTIDEQRSLAARLVNDLQWRYTVNEVKRRYSEDITRRTGNLFATALLLFGLWITYLVFADPNKSWELRLPILAGLAGTWGASFSLLSSLKGRLENSELDDLKLMRPNVILISRALIGTGAGSVLYFFLRAGLLGGTAFPTLTAANLASEPAKYLAWLTVWCFVAGFSEKFVPSLLDKTETRGISSITTDRQRPGSDGTPPAPPPPTDKTDDAKEKPKTPAV